jgi:hypothetical protein
MGSYLLQLALTQASSVQNWGGDWLEIASKKILPLDARLKFSVQAGECCRVLCTGEGIAALACGLLSDRNITINTTPNPG